MEAAGHHVLEAADGIDALEVADQEPIDLFLVDMNMPRLDGLGLLQEIRTRPRYKDTPIFVLTTESSAELVAEVLRDVDELRGRIDELEAALNQCCQTKCKADAYQRAGWKDGLEAAAKVCDERSSHHIAGDDETPPRHVIAVESRHCAAAIRAKSGQ